MSTQVEEKSVLLYGSQDQVQTSETIHRHSKRSKLWIAMNILIILSLLSLCISMSNTINELHLKVNKSEATQEAIDNSITDLHKKHEVYDRGYIPQAMLPSKFAVKYVTPLKDQADRGTCWDFATIAFLEQSYRAHGVANNWLEEDEYVAFSEQAYGVEVLELCTGPPTSPQQIDCRVIGDEVWENSTEGGEVPDLYYLRQGLKNSVFPLTVCPYYIHEGNDTRCPGLEDARKVNPLRFEVEDMETKYDDLSVKAHIFQKNQAMPLSMPIAMVTHYFPCIGEFASDFHCRPETCTLCPPDMAMTTCCVPLKGGRNWNMEGEFFSHRGMSIDDGHAVLLVGYNDAFQTRDGFNGGLIIKNSWADGKRQGSHSLGYWMQEISDWEERAICPNSYNPFNWYQCGNSGVNGKLSESNETYNEHIQDCLSNDTQIFAQVNLQPLHLHCADNTYCNTTDDYIYFVRNTTDWGDRMTVMCLWEYSEMHGIAREFCLPPMLEFAMAKVVQPDSSEVQENDTDRCGFYFVPYLALRSWISQFQGFFVNSFDIKWAPESYLANKDDYPSLDYSLLEASTKKQHMDAFDGPFPYAKVVQTFPPSNR